MRSLMNLRSVVAQVGRAIRSRRNLSSSASSIVAGLKEAKGEPKSLLKKANGEPNEKGYSLVGYFTMGYSTFLIGEIIKPSAYEQTLMREKEKETLKSG